MVALVHMQNKKIFFCCSLSVPVQQRMCLEQQIEMFSWNREQRIWPELFLYHIIWRLVSHCKTFPHNVPVLDNPSIVQTKGNK